MNYYTTNRLGKVLLQILLLLLIYPAVSFSQANKINPILFKKMQEKAVVPVAVDNTKNRSVSMFMITPTVRAVRDSSGGASNELFYDCIVYTKNGAELKKKGYDIGSVLPNFVTAKLTAAQISALSSDTTVRYIDLPKIHKTNNDIAVAQTGADLLHAGRLNNTAYLGNGVIVAVYDTGIDWNHPDFKNADGTSRILCIWDQTLTPTGSEVSAPGTDYGVYYTQAQINAELASPTGSIREQDSFGHGTHVTGTAAGNGNALPSKQYMGMAPEADIIVIKGGNGTFYSNYEIDGINFLQHMADSLQRPIVLNMSLGGQGSAHDGTDATEQAIDVFTASGNGRAVVVAAGNDNGSNIHNETTLPASGGGVDKYQFYRGKRYR